MMTVGKRCAVRQSFHNVDSVTVMILTAACTLDTIEMNMIVIVSTNTTTIIESVIRDSIFRLE